MAGFTQGEEWLPKNGASFYGEAYISLNLSIECLQPNCMYQLGVKRCPNDFCWVIVLLALV